MTVFSLRLEDLSLHLLHSAREVPVRAELDGGHGLVDDGLDALFNVVRVCGLGDGVLGNDHVPVTHSRILKSNP